MPALHITYSCKIYHNYNQKKILQIGMNQEDSTHYIRKVRLSPHSIFRLEPLLVKRTSARIILIRIRIAQRTARHLRAAQRRFSCEVFPMISLGLEMNDKVQAPLQLIRSLDMQNCGVHPCCFRIVRAQPWTFFWLEGTSYIFYL